MAKSLQDQLLEAGLVNKERADQLRRESAEERNRDRRGGGRRGSQSGGGSGGKSGTRQARGEGGDNRNRRGRGTGKPRGPRRPGQGENPTAKSNGPNEKPGTAENAAKAGDASSQQGGANRRRRSRGGRRNNQPGQNAATRTPEANSGSNSGRHRVFTARAPGTPGESGIRSMDRTQRKARANQIRQILKDNHLSRDDGDIDWHFVVGRKVKKIHVTAEQRDRLTRAELIILWYDERFWLLPEAIESQILELDPHATLVRPRAAGDEEDPWDALLAAEAEQAEQHAEAGEATQAAADAQEDALEATVPDEIEATAAQEDSAEAMPSTEAEVPAEAQEEPPEAEAEASVDQQIPAPRSDTSSDESADAQVLAETKRPQPADPG